MNYFYGVSAFTCPCMARKYGTVKCFWCQQNIPECSANETRSSCWSFCSVFRKIEIYFVHSKSNSVGVQRLCSYHHYLISYTFITLEETLYLSVICAHFALPWPLAAPHSSASCLCGLGWSLHFLPVKSHTGFSHSASGFPGSSFCSSVSAWVLFVAE